MYDHAKYLVAGDCGIVVEIGNEISNAVNQKVRGFLITLESAEIEGIISINPTYRSLLIEYDPLIIGYEELTSHLMEMENQLADIQLPSPRVLEVPTLYGGEHGPDLEFVAEHANLSVEEVIRIHSSTDYPVFMLGFSPGFPYLGGMDPAIETPRLKNPRASIPGGSVGIAGKQTGMYPQQSPGGWQLIGRTPIQLYDPLREPAILHQTGDIIRFVPITREQYDEIERAVADGTYEYKMIGLRGDDNE